MLLAGLQLAVSTNVMKQDSTAVGRAYLSKQSFEIEREEIIREVSYIAVIL